MSSSWCRKPLSLSSKSFWQLLFSSGIMGPTHSTSEWASWLLPSWTSGRCVDITHDWSSLSRPTVESSEAFKPITTLEYNSTTFKSHETSFAGFISFTKNMFSLSSPIADQAQEHMYFLIYKLNKYVFPNKSKGEKLEWIPLLEVLHSFDYVATWPFIKAHLYHLLYEMTMGQPFESKINRATWMVQL